MEKRTTIKGSIFSIDCCRSVLIMAHIKTKFQSHQNHRQGISMDDLLQRITVDRKVLCGKPLEELSVIALTEYDAETRFRARASRGSKKRGLEILDKLDQHYQKLDQNKG